MFIDEVILELEAGNGGDGCLAYHREKYVEFGGPDGGSGGKGSDIVFVVDQGLNTLIDLRYQKVIRGKKGTNGGGKGKHGGKAEDIIIKVPEGTVIKDIETNLIIADLTNKEDKIIAVVGGRGGRGNIALATGKNLCPTYAENGEPGETRKVKIELKLLADVGLVGMPSVGKSTIISKISAAKPKIAAYHFTTLRPNLGVVQTKDKRSYVVADLPGLIKGASLGEGLGDQFLKHIERTRVIAHVVDISGSEGRDPFEDFLTINDELNNYNDSILRKPQIIIANKIDIEGSEEKLKEFKKKVKDIPIFPISAEQNRGLDDLINHLANMLDKIEKKPLYSEDSFEKHILYKFEQKEVFKIFKEDNKFIVRGELPEKILRMTRFSGEEAFVRFVNKLRRIGIDEELEKMNIQDGDIVSILDFEFEYRK
jgi:GTP-binding protein